jgi:integrase
VPVRLTKRYLDALKPRSARYTVADAEIPGFLVRVSPDGSKAFSLLYRAGSGRRAARRRVTLGRYGQITLDQARQLAKGHLANVARGEDPAQDRAAQRRAATVAELGEAFLDDVAATRKPATAYRYRLQWQRIVVPALGAVPVVGVTAADIAKLHRGLRGTPVYANRIIALLGSFFHYAERQGVRPKGSSPTREVTMFREQARERFLTPTEAMAIGEAIRRAEQGGLPPAAEVRERDKRADRKRTHGNRGPYQRTAPLPTPTPANPFAVAALRFLILSGWRVSEVLTLRWRDLTADYSQAILADSKTGRSVRHLGAPVKHLLDGLPRIKGSPYVFPSATHSSKPINTVTRLWYAVREAAGLLGVRLHDLRHSHASVVASGGGSLLIIGKLLGHKRASTTQRYAHLLDDPVKQAADAASSQIAGWLGGASSSDPLRAAPKLKTR